MRFSLYAPILGLSAMAALAQNSPRGPYNTHHEATEDWIRGSLPVVQEPFAPRLMCELCTAAAPAKVKAGGANRGAIERAIRALGARVFPGNRLAPKPPGGSLRMDRQPGFRIAGGR